MGIVLGVNQYGKAEVRLVHVDRTAPRHVLTDLNISTHLRGAFDATYLTGDNASVLATDTQKNTVYAFARKFGVGTPEDFAIRLGRHFVESQEPVKGAQIEIDQLPWDHLDDHSFARPGGERRTTSVTFDGDQVWVVSGLTDLVVLKTTGSEFHGFPRDEYTTLPETTDRILATSVTARWRYSSADLAFGEIYPAIRAVLLETFSATHSLALQQTLYAMGRAVLEKFGEVAEVRLSMPNKHHYLADLSPFGLDNPNEVFIAGDRPYGLIEGQVLREEAPDAGPAWQFVPGFA
ncbi:factor-independent urate hydroxylase [Kineosporia sp. NBRC 101731]|uniref:factor-independent urate hydroxylase n=1 Tax=Kineosporia sp. NBRC 101731 TaxID=3032199 RepID=UPI0024A4DC9A|nr:urate oxidase [Kineosporia sp. NBRC 101731]GLY31209.1 uricase [Kineosporia sp. NBRC 101731]